MFIPGLGLEGNLLSNAMTTSFSLSSVFLWPLYAIVFVKLWPARFVGLNQFYCMVRFNECDVVA